MTKLDSNLLIVIAWTNGPVASIEVTEDEDQVDLALLAPDDLEPVNVVVALLSAAVALLPESQSKFRGFQASFALKQELAAVNDRMKAHAETSSDELPF